MTVTFFPVFLPGSDNQFLECLLHTTVKWAVDNRMTLCLAILQITMQPLLSDRPRAWFGCK